MDISHLTEEELNNPCIRGWIEQKELNLDDAITNEVLPKIITQDKIEYIYAWLTPVKYNITKIYGCSLDNEQPDEYAYFYLTKAYGCGFFMESTETIFEDIYSFSSKKAALKAREKARQYLHEEMANDRFIIPNDGGINSLLLSKHLELLNRCKLYKIKISNRASWELTEEN